MRGNAAPYSGEDRSCRGIHSFCAGRDRRMRVLRTRLQEACQRLGIPWEIQWLIHGQDT